jgi:hypothetical protein
MAVIPSCARRRGASQFAVEELLPQIFLFRIPRPHQIAFLLPAPTLDFFPCDGREHRHSFRNTRGALLVLLDETLDGSVLVFANATLVIIRHANVQDAASAIGHHLDKERLHSIVKSLAV